MRPIFGRFVPIYLLCAFVILFYYQKYFQDKVSSELPTSGDVFTIVPKYQDNKTNLYYLLLWTSPKNVPFVYMGLGQQTFIDRKCPYTNCFVTSDRQYLEDYTKFDVIAFAGPEVVNMKQEGLPDRRSPHQKYVFANIESAENYPVCSNRFDGFFNWTWTYKLDSDSKWGYIIVRDANGKIIGPNKEMHWIKKKEMLPVSEELKTILRGKTKAAAWFVSNCHTIRKREQFTKDLQKELSKYELSVDIYGLCGNFKCSRDEEEKCNEVIKKDYYFYLSFENSFSEDYVTEKLVRAVEYYAIPVVFGGANYSRFLPEGSYLDARKLGPVKLAAKISELMQNFDQYTEYFRWTSHYTYHRRDKTVETDDYCGFCALLNDRDKVKQPTIYKNFREWWDPVESC